MEVTMNAIDLNTTAGREYCGRPSKQDDDHRAIHTCIARSIAIAIIFATLSLTEWYGSAVYGSPLSSEQSALAAGGVAFGHRCINPS
jgi:hypothetical protein